MTERALAKWRIGPDIIPSRALPPHERAGACFHGPGAKSVEQEATMTQSKGKVGPRFVALVGTYLSGKTTLLESLLSVAGAIPRKGAVGDGTALGDSSPEARAHAMGIELNLAHGTYMGEEFAFVDCPGSIEFFQQTLDVLPAIDAAIVVCDPDADKSGMLKPVLKALDDRRIPHFIFVNKIDKATGPIHDLFAVLQKESEKPVVVRQIPIIANEHVTGFVDLALERAYHYKLHQPSEQVELKGDLVEAEKTARFQMLERLADHDDHLMEMLLEDAIPERTEVVDGLARELEAGEIVPVLLGSALNDNGIRRLWKALRHEVPGVAAARRRLVSQPQGAAAYVFKTVHTAHGGKLSLARIMSGAIKDGDTLKAPDEREARLAGISRLQGVAQEKRTEAKEGETVALGRLDPIRTGDTLGNDRGAPKAMAVLARLTPVYHVAIGVKDRKDEVKMSSAIAKLIEEDPSLVITHVQDTHETLLSGQGEMHLRIARERLKSKYALEIETHPPRVPYKEAIRKSVTQRGRHKKQSGGHGQFGDVVVEIQPTPRGAGFVFTNSITGGVVPRNYIPAVEAGVRDYLEKGPLGFPVVDVAVNLTDGSYHDVDSSDMAFRIAGRIAMQEGMPQCQPVLLEPIMKVEVYVPSAATPKINQIVTGRRGQLMGFDGREGWPGWDVIFAQIPQAELQNFIIELRSVTAGAGTYTSNFDHLQELTGRLADQVLQQHNGAAK
jgi:elongation factor G